MGVVGVAPTNRGTLGPSSLFVDHMTVKTLNPLRCRLYDRKDPKPFRAHREDSYLEATLETAAALRKDQRDSFAKDETRPDLAS